MCVRNKTRGKEIQTLRPGLVQNNEKEGFTLCEESTNINAHTAKNTWKSNFFFFYQNFLC